MKNFFIIIFCFLNVVLYSQQDTIFQVETSQKGYCFMTSTGDIVSVSNKLNGFSVEYFEYFVEIPKDYKKVSFYLNNDADPTISIFNVKKGYIPIFLPSSSQKIYAVMDDEVYEGKHIILNKKN